MKTRHIPLGDLEQRNKLAKELYQAALDCKAALFQGKKKGRAFLLYIQQAFLNSPTSYNEALALSAAKACKLDVDMFLEDRQSEFTEHQFQQDQQLAAKMNVTDHPTLVLYNLEGFDCGVAVTGCDSFDVLESIIHGNIPRELILEHQTRQRLHPLKNQKKSNLPPC